MTIPAAPRSTYARSSTDVYRDLYRLLSAIYASAPLHALRDELGGPIDSVRGLRAACELPEVHETLLRLAAGFRVLQDQVELFPPGTAPRNVNPFHDDCGILWRDESTSESTKLSLREACNKILHAKKIEHTFAARDDSFNYALGQCVVLRGTYESKPWKCELDILKFVDCLHYNFDPDAV